jgi:L-rhamnose isomerase
MECTGDFTGRLEVLEETKILPAGAVWDYYCQQQNVPVASAGLDAVRTYKREVQCKRS